MNMQSWTAYVQHDFDLERHPYQIHDFSSVSTVLDDDKMLPISGLVNLTRRQTSWTFSVATWGLALRAPGSPFKPLLSCMLTLQPRRC